jgi:hypothetical protein
MCNKCKLMLRILLVLLQKWPPVQGPLLLTASVWPPALPAWASTAPSRDSRVLGRLFRGCTFTGSKVTCKNGAHSHRRPAVRTPAIIIVNFGEVETSERGILWNVFALFKVHINLYTWTSGLSLSVQIMRKWLFLSWKINYFDDYLN